jgi:hypothetical protein
MILRNNAHPKGIDVGPGRGRMEGHDEDAPRRHQLDKEYASAGPGFSLQGSLARDACPPSLAGISGDRPIGPTGPCSHGYWLICEACWPEDALWDYDWEQAA